MAEVSACGEVQHRPRPFSRCQGTSRGYGNGLRLDVSLGGEGVFFVAWQVAYLHKSAGKLSA